MVPDPGIIPQTGVYNYLYIKHLIFLLLVSIHEYSLLEFFSRNKIAQEVRYLQDNGLVEFYFFNKVDVFLSLGPTFWIFMNVKKPNTMNLVEFEFKCDFVIEQLLVLFGKILKTSGNYFYDIRKYDKKKYENSMSEFRLYNIYLMVVDCTNLFNALINRLSLGNRRKFVYKVNFEIKEIFSKCIIITLSKKQCQTIIFESIRLKRTEKDNADNELIYFLDIQTHKIIIDIDNQNPPLKSLLLTFETRSKKKMKHMLTFDPLSIQ
jgi:hypothetical protein